MANPYNEMISIWEYSICSNFTCNGEKFKGDIYILVVQVIHNIARRYGLY